MTFEIEDFTNAKLTSVNCRSEKHGPDDLMPAVDLSFTIDAPNTVLSSFDKHLLSSIYFKSENGPVGGQGTLEGVEELAALPNLRFPNMGPLKWGKDLTGYTLTIDHGLGGKSELVLADCKVNEFRLNPKEGGTVEVKFRVQCSTSLNEKTLGKLSLLIQHEIPIKLAAPEASDKQVDFDNPFPVDGDSTPPANPFLSPEAAFEQSLLQ